MDDAAGIMDPRSGETVGVFEQIRRTKEVSLALARVARRNRATVGQTFRDFDTDSSGAITPEQMMHGLCRMRVPEMLSFRLDRPTVVSLVDSFDLDHDGVLTEQDWRDYFRRLRGELERDNAPQNTPVAEPLQSVDSAVADTPLARTASEDGRIDELRGQTSSADWHDSIREYATHHCILIGFWSVLNRNWVQVN